VASEYWPSLTSDGLLLFFESSRSITKEGADGGYVADRSRIWTSTRPNLLAEFSEPRIQTIFQVEPGAGYAGEGSPYLHPNGKTLYFMSDVRGGHGALDIFVASLEEFGAASSITNIDAVNTDGREQMPVITIDEKTLYFAHEDKITTLRVIWKSTRASPTGTFGAPEPVNELNTVYDQFPDWISDDECRMYFSSNRPSPADDGGAPTFHLWVAERPKQ
jgi:hypothetical protein